MMANENTNLGEIREDNVSVFSGGTSAFMVPTITIQSPEETDFTLPFNHPVAEVDDAMAKATICIT